MTDEELIEWADRQQRIRTILNYLQCARGDDGGALKSRSISPPANFCILLEDGDELFLEDAGLGCLEREH
jgi:hypothetical protein